MFHYKFPNILIALCMQMPSAMRRDKTTHDSKPNQAIAPNTRAKLERNMSTPGVEPGLSRPRRDVLTTRRCGQFVVLQANNVAVYELFTAAQPRQPLANVYFRCSKASRGVEPRSLDSESRVLTVTPRGRTQSILVQML